MIVIYINSKRYYYNTAVLKPFTMEKNKMEVATIQKEIAQRICSIGDHIIQNNLSFEVIESGCKEIEADKEKLLKLLSKYGNGQVFLDRKF